jgi:hypothetical protein
MKGVVAAASAPAILAALGQVEGVVVLAAQEIVVAGCARKRRHGSFPALPHSGAAPLTGPSIAANPRPGKARRHTQTMVAMAKFAAD